MIASVKFIIFVAIAVLLALLIDHALRPDIQLPSMFLGFTSGLFVMTFAVSNGWL